VGCLFRHWVGRDASINNALESQPTAMRQKELSNVVNGRDFARNGQLCERTNAIKDYRNW
jgi:hypothetical protein